MTDRNTCPRCGERINRDYGKCHCQFRSVSYPATAVSTFSGEQPAEIPGQMNLLTAIAKIQRSYPAHRQDPKELSRMTTLACPSCEETTFEQMRTTRTMFTMEYSSAYGWTDTDEEVYDSGDLDDSEIVCANCGEVVGIENKLSNPDEEEDA